MSRRDAILGAALAALALTASHARADIAPPENWRDPPRARVYLTLTSVRVTTSDAPASDADFVRREAEGELAGLNGRLRRCLDGADLREDPLRGRDRYIEGTLTFDRSPRGRLSMGRGVGVPRAARACLAEAARSIRVRTTPHGRVVVRFRYVLR